MTYRIRFTNKNKTPIEVGENSINNSSVDITLFGRRKLEYGAELNANFLHLLENFACPETALPLPTPSPTPSSAVCNTAPPGATPEPSTTPSPGSSLTPTPTPTGSSVVVVTPTPTGTPANTPNPSATPTPATVSQTPQASVTPTPAASTTPQASVTPTPSNTPQPSVTPTPSPVVDSGNLIPFGVLSIEQYQSDFHSTGIAFNGYTNNFTPATETTRYGYRLETNGFDVVQGSYVDTGAVLGDEPSDWQNQYWVYVTGGATPDAFTEVAVGSIPIGQWTLIGLGASYQVSLQTAVTGPEPSQNGYTLTVYMQRSATQPAGLGGATLMGTLNVVVSSNDPP